MKKLAKLLLTLALIWTPFQSSPVNALIGSHANSKIVFFVSNWPELVFVPSLAALLIYLILKRPKLTPVDWLALSICALALLSWSWSDNTLRDQVIGARYTLPIIYAYGFARISSITLIEVKAITQRVLPWVLCIMFVQILYWSILPDSPYWTVQHTIPGGWPRVYGPLIGPNQLGSYLLFTSFMVWDTKKLPNLLIISAWVGIILSQSRASILGLGVALLIYALYSRRNKILAYLPIFEVGSFYTAFQCIVALTTRTSLSAVALTHGDSQSGHAYGTESFLNHFSNLSQFKWVLGEGLGFASPAIFVLGKGILPESWWLQILVELGIVGLGIYAAFILLPALKLYQNKQIGPALAIIAVSINALFLHTFADNYALTIVLGALIASVVIVQAKQSD